tara:strand:+ start:679 stop:1131 length:453 start_codon:yes stop_codon:yes gene_type:complete
MKKKFLLIIFLITFALSAKCNQPENLTPQEFLKYLIKVFNSQNSAILKELFQYPHVKIINGKLTIANNKNIVAWDFEKLRQSGWVRSKFFNMQLYKEGDNSAIISAFLIRFDKDDKKIHQGEIYYVLTKKEKKWQIISVTSVGNIIGAKN